MCFVDAKTLRLFRAWVLEFVLLCFGGIPEYRFVDWGYA